MWRRPAGQAWWHLVQQGEVWTPWDVEKEHEIMALLLGIRVAELSGTQQTLMVNTWQGSPQVWRIAEHLERSAWDCVAYAARSAGLILACACRGERKARAEATFLFHALDVREFAAEDRRRAEWFAARTTQPVEFWLDLCSKGDTEFGAEEALAWGVVHEIEKGA